MKKSLLAGLGLVTLIMTFLFRPALVTAACREQLIRDARQEGTVEVALPSSLTVRGAKEMEEAFNTKYGLNLKVHYTPSMSYSMLASQSILEHRQGVRATYDIIIAGPESYFLNFASRFRFLDSV